MVRVSWGSSLEINPKSIYLAMDVDMERKGVWSFFSFLRQAQALIPELRNAKGIVGYAGTQSSWVRKQGFYQCGRMRPNYTILFILNHTPTQW